MKAFLLTLLLNFSCTKYSEVTRGSMGVAVKDVRMDLSDLHEITWSVGKFKEGKVTQSITFVMDLPRLQTEDIDFLIEQRGVNAWIVRVIQYQGSGRSDLGSFFVPFRPQRQNQGRGFAESMSSKVSLKIFYASAFASVRFRAFNCPAFGHDKRVVSMKIKGENDPFDINLGQSSPYQEKSQLANLTPSTFNGGHQLKAEYRFEIAPYNMNKKVILGEFKRLPRYVEIAAEEAQRIDSCKGVHQERMD